MGQESKQKEKECCTRMLYIGIDNGVSGSVGIISDDKMLVSFFKVPTDKEQDYTKKKKRISRLNVVDFGRILHEHGAPEAKMTAGIERPMINSRRFQASISAARCLEATLVVLHLASEKGIPYMFFDSKEWQKELLPKKLAGRQLKIASREIGCRLFPDFREEIQKHGDADGLLIAEYMRRKRL